MNMFQLLVQGFPCMGVEKSSRVWGLYEVCPLQLALYGEVCSVGVRPLYRGGSQYG